ncbi:MAG: glycoside-pentoside-hexuronide (GPH):cation symporter [Coriobacteriales bacterium]|nr:glycoside-pentoside-hexuronide (GPH):cation symporter [Coriobacteriales bacterium]
MMATPDTLQATIVPSAPTTEKVRLREKLGFTALHGSVEMFAQILSLYLLVFYTNVAGIPPALAGTLMLICTIWNGVNDPIVGWLVDNHRFKNGEKIRPLIKWVAVPTALFAIILFWMPALDPTWAFIYALLVYCIMDSFSTFLGIPYMSFPSVMTSDPNERVSLGTFATAGASLGPLVASLFTVPLMRTFGGVDALGNVLDQRTGFHVIIVVFMAICVICQFFVYAVTRERVRPEKTTTDHIGLFKAFKILFTERNFMAIVGYNLLYSFALSSVIISVVYFTTYVLRMPGGEAILSPILILVALLSLPFIRLVNKYASRRGILITAAIAMLVSKIPLFIAPTSFIAACISAGLIGVAMGFSVTGISANLNESIEIAAWNKGYRLEGSAVALRGLILKIGLAFLAFMLGLGMQFSGYIAPTEEVLQPVQNEATQLVFQTSFIYFPAVVAIGMLIIAFLSPTDRDAAAMRAAKKAAAEAEAANGTLS